MRYDIEVVYVGSAGHLRRYKVVDEQGQYVPGGLFRTEQAARAFIADHTDRATESDVTIYGAGSV
jgi:hypothetical protein